MTISELITEFDIVIDTTEGLAELRSLILGLAVRGKLVPQDPNDEPASELLKKIVAEKERLYEEGDIRKPRKLKDLVEEEIPYELPKTWLWCRIGDVAKIQGGGTPKTSETKNWSDKGIPWVTPADFNVVNSKYIRRGKRDISEEGLSSSSTFLLPKGSVLFSSRAPIGYVAIAENDICTNQGFQSSIPYLLSTNDYIYYYLKYIGKIIDERASGTTFKEVSGTFVANVEFPLPPLAEQLRIVQKIESLFSEVDELEVMQNRQTKLDEKLQMAVNAEVQKAPDAEASKSAWTFITSHFDTLYHTHEAIDNLKKNILNEAVRGRLVPQNPDDEPASELLKKIEAEKQRLYDEGEIRKPKELPSIEEDEIPFEIPESWKWCRLGETCLNLIDGNYGESYPKKDEFLENGVPFFTGASVGEKFNIRHQKTKYISAEKHKELTKAQSTIGDLIFINRGARVGGVAQIREAEYSDCNIGPQVTRIAVDHERMNKDYVMFSIASPKFQSRIMELNSGSAMNFMNLTKTSNMIIAVPPNEEQHRIVRRIEELFAICDRFKAQLWQREKVNERLVKGLVQEVLEGS